MAGSPDVPCAWSRLPPLALVAGESGRSVPLASGVTASTIPTIAWSTGTKRFGHRLGGLAGRDEVDELARAGHVDGIGGHELAAHRRAGGGRAAG